MHKRMKQSKGNKIMKQSKNRKGKQFPSEYNHHTVGYITNV